MELLTFSYNRWDTQQGFPVYVWSGREPKKLCLDVEWLLENMPQHLCKSGTLLWIDQVLCFPAARSDFLNACSAANLVYFARNARKIKSSSPKLCWHSVQYHSCSVTMNLKEWDSL